MLVIESKKDHLRVEHVLPVHPDEQVHVPGLLHTPLVQVGVQTAEKKMARMKFSFVNNHAYVLSKLDQTTMMYKYTCLEQYMCQNFDMLMHKQLEYDDSIYYL